MFSLEQQQLAMALLGYYDLRYEKEPRKGDLAIDGIPGPALKNAIRQFQTEHRERPNGTFLWVDGQWGPATEAAFREVVGTNEAPQVEEAPPPAKSPSGDPYPWLLNWEKLIRCQCGGRYCKGLPEQGFSRKTLEMANEVGRQLGVRLRCTSGYRCPKRNAETPGASPTSCHMRAIAFDCQAENRDVSPEKLFSTADKVVGNQGGVGIYSWGIHIDSRGYRARWDSR